MTQVIGVYTNMKDNPNEQERTEDPSSASSKDSDAGSQAGDQTTQGEVDVNQHQTIPQGVAPQKDGDSAGEADTGKETGEGEEDSAASGEERDSIR